MTLSKLCSAVVVVFTQIKYKTQYRFTLAYL